MSRIEHPLSKEELMAYVDGQLQGSEASRVAEHLHGCPDCAAAVDELVARRPVRAEAVRPGVIAIGVQEFAWCQGDLAQERHQTLHGC